MLSLTLTVISVVIALLAALISYQAYSVAHGDAVSDRLFNSLSDLLATLTRIEFAGDKLYRSDRDGDNIDIWQEVLPDFRSFREAVIRVELAHAPIQGGQAEDEIGSWIIDVANNLAASILQADESEGSWRKHTGCEEALFDDWPASVPDVGRNYLMLSSSFWTVYGVTKDLPQPDFGVLDKWRGKDFMPLEQWWAEKVMRYPDVPSVYHPSADWMIQHSRLLSEFGESYLSPWAQYTVTRPERQNNPIAKILARIKSRKSGMDTISQMSVQSLSDADRRRLDIT